MNKKLSIFLVIALLTAFAGCAKKPTVPAVETNTQPQITSLESKPESVASEPTASEPEEIANSKESSSVSQKDESAKEAEKEASEQNKLYTGWSQDQHNQAFCAAKGISHDDPAFQTGQNTLCRTSHELTKYLQEMGVSTQYAQAYPDSFFETNCLLLISKGFGSPGVELYIEDVAVQDNTLITAWSSRVRNVTAIDVLVYRIYFVPIHQRLDHIDTIQSTITFMNENASGEYVTTDQTTTEYSVS